MFIKSIRIENFQQYQKVFELNELVPGLNIIYGDNEAGKSTLLRALRAVLFDRFNGKAAEDYTGYFGGSPEVAIQFNFQGKDYQLSKIFSKKKEGSATLSDDSGYQWIGSEAETYLTNLLGCDSIERGIAKPEQQGIYGILWVEQGRAWEQVRLTDNPGASLAVQNVLSRELTDMLSQGKGEILLNIFSSDLKQYQTEKTGKPSGELKSKMDAIDSAQTKLNRLETELKNYQDKVDELDKHKQELDHFIENNIEQEDKNQLALAEEALRHIESLNEEYEAAEQNFELMQAKHESALGKHQERIGLIGSLEQENVSLEEKRAELVILRNDLTQCQSTVQVSHQVLEDARTAHEQASSQLEKARAYQQLLMLQKNIEKMNDQLEQVNKLHIELDNAQEKLAQILIDDSGLKNIKKLCRQVDSLKIRLDAISTQLQFTIDTGSEIFLDDQPLSGDGEKLITKRSDLKFSLNKITIIPGGDELATLHQQLHQANEELRVMFESYNLVSIDEAEMQFTSQVALQSEINSIKNQIKIIVPDGLEQLKESLSTNKGEQKNLQVKVGKENPGSIEDTESLLINAKREYDNAQAKERRLHETLTTKKEEVRQLDNQFSEVEKKVGLLSQQLQLARNNTLDEALKNQEHELNSKVQEAQVKITQLKTELEDVDSDGMRLEVERRRKSLLNSQEKLDKLNSRIYDLELELVATGHRGLAEEKEQAEQELTKETAEYKRLSGHVGSLNLLCKIIREEIQKAKDLVVQPLTEALKPYLKILFPDAEPVIDENFCLQLILRNGVSETFENLSMGTREQLAILIRLAYADLLTASGTPAMVVLDDALVNTDDSRNEKMKQILYRASQNYQIILLTCHGKAYRDCGGAIYKIE